jgi:hypothetical protein
MRRFLHVLCQKKTKELVIIFFVNLIQTSEYILTEYKKVD